jgi:hypothetical protein
MRHGDLAGFVIMLEVMARTRNPGQPQSVAFKETYDFSTIAIQVNSPCNIIHTLKFFKPKGDFGL